jgi:hypothetical protein
MQPVTVPMGKRQIVLSTVRGEVAGEKIWASTEISGGGGGGYVTQGSGAITDVEVKSKVTEHLQFFVRVPGEKEIPVNLTDTRVSVRTGHDVSLLWAKWAHKSGQHVLAIHNHSTGETKVLDKNRRPFDESLFWMVRSIGAMLAVVAAIGWSFYEGGLNFAGHVLFFVIGGVLVIPGFRAFRKGRARQNGFSAACAAVLNELKK